MSDLSLVQRIRQEMPATTAHVYFNTGTFGPTPDCVLQAMEKRLQEEHKKGRLGLWEATSALFDDARTRVAQLLNADKDEIALTGNTGEGMNIISYGINWQQGDDVIIPPSVSDEQAKQKFPKGWKTLKPYLRIIPQPRD